MEKTNLKYIHISDNQDDLKYPTDYYLEVTVDFNENRRVTHYKDGSIKAADEKGGFEGEELAHGKIVADSLEEFNNPPKTSVEEITKEKFESEWQKAISQPDFELKPYC